MLFTLGKAVDGFERWDKAQIIVQDIKSGERTTIINGGSSARYVESGHLLYVNGGTVFAAPFDPVRLKVLGDAAPVVEGEIHRFDDLGLRSDELNLEAGREGESLELLLGRERILRGNDGRLLRGEIHHQQWPLQPAEAEFRCNTMALAAGLALDTVTAADELRYQNLRARGYAAVADYERKKAAKDEAEDSSHG